MSTASPPVPGTAPSGPVTAAGYHVITYVRCGTGGSGRDDWPGGAVVGVSSGALIALDLAARHPALVEHVVAWEPPALGLLPDAAAQGDDVMAPVQARLAANPGDYVGAQAILLSAILDIPVVVGISPNDVVAAVVRALTEITGREPITDVVRRAAAAGRTIERQVVS
ncbi:MAG: alpha/beta hydrolase [Actinophytocola sp.]|uniref:alpha/beta fold hydrolase n=1 Tax=Actinophytocola sp. TaxID=1872138 RepID=UPI003D6BD374